MVNHYTVVSWQFLIYQLRGHEVAMLRVLFGAIKDFRMVGKSFQFFEWVSKNKNLVLLLGLSKCHKIF
jgi:hypothetical protein